jgi:hypothetical protein
VQQSAGTAARELHVEARPYKETQSTVHLHLHTQTCGKSQVALRARHQCSSSRPQLRSAAQGEKRSASHPRSRIAFITAWRRAAPRGQRSNEGQKRQYAAVHCS